MATEQKIEVRPRSWLTPVALVLLREESFYGYELMEGLAKFGFDEEIRAGMLYRTLRRMEHEGLCKSEWDTSEDGPPQRMYSLTEAGEAYLAAWIEGYRKYQTVMDCFFRVYCAR